MKTLFINWFRTNVLNRRVECPDCEKQLKLIIDEVSRCKEFTITFTPLVKKKEVIHWHIKFKV